MDEFKLKGYILPLITTHKLLHTNHYDIVTLTDSCYAEHLYPKGAENGQVEIQLMGWLNGQLRCNHKLYYGARRYEPLRITSNPRVYNIGPYNFWLKAKRSLKCV